MVKLSLDSQELAKEHPSNYSSIYTKILSGYVLRFEYQKRRLSHGAAVDSTSKEIEGGAVRCGLWLESRKEIVRTIRIHATDRVLRNCGLWLKYKKGKSEAARDVEIEIVTMPIM